MARVDKEVRPVLALDAQSLHAASDVPGLVEQLVLRVRPLRSGLLASHLAANAVLQKNSALSLLALLVNTPGLRLVSKLVFVHFVKGGQRPLFLVLAQEAVNLLRRCSGPGLPRRELLLVKLPPTAERHFLASVRLLLRLFVESAVRVADLLRLREGTFLVEHDFVSAPIAQNVVHVLRVGRGRHVLVGVLSVVLHLDRTRFVEELRPSRRLLQRCLELGVCLIGRWSVWCWFALQHF